MATKVRGITIELGADASGITKALSSVNKSIGQTQKDLKDVERLLKLDPTNTELMAQKQKLLTDAISETKTKLDTLKEAQKNVDMSTEEGQRQYDALTREIVSCENELKQLEKQARSAKTAFEAMSAAGEKLKGVGSKIESAGKSLKYVSGAAAGALTGIVKTTADFDASMSKVAAVSGAAGEEFDALRDKAREMGATTKFTASDAAEALNYMAMAGWKTEQMLEGIDGIMNLAAASGEELGTTSDIVTDALTAFGMSAEESARFADILASASSNANTNVAMMGESFKYAAPVAGSLGYSAEDVAVALGLMANSGIKASMAGTSLRNMFQRMAKPTKESSDAMDRLGIALYDDEGKMYAFRDIMDQLRDSMGNINVSIEDYEAQLDQLDAALEDGTLTQKKYDDELEELNLRTFGAEGAEKARAAAMLGGARAMSGLLAIANATEEDYNKLTKAIDNSSQAFAKTEDGIIPLNEALASGKEILEQYDGAAAAMAATMQDNASGQMEILKSQVQEFAISLGDLLMPVIRDVIEKLQGLMDKFNSLDDSQKQTILNVLMVVAALAPLLIVIGKLTSAVGTILTIIPKIGAAISWLLANPIALLIAAIITLVVLIATKGDEIQAALQRVDDFFQNIFTKDWTEQFGALGDVMNAFMANVKNVWDAVKTIFDGIINFIRGVFTGDWKRAWEGVKEIFGGAFKALEALAKAPLNGIIGMLNGTIDSINKVITGFNGIGFDMPEWLGGGSFHPHIPTIPVHIPYLESGGILTQGTAVVGENGAELLSVNNGQAIVQPLGGQNGASELTALLETYLPYLATGQQLVLDTGALVGGTASQMNTTLGTIGIRGSKR